MVHPYFIGEIGLLREQDNFSIGMAVTKYLMPATHRENCSSSRGPRHCLVGEKGAKGAGASHR
jgi:hypothetical protein